MIFNELSSAEKRYQTDAMFAALVNELTHYIESGSFTPSELRDAVILAHTKYEMYHMPSPVFIQKMRQAFSVIDDPAPSGRGEKE